MKSVHIMYILLCLYLIAMSIVIIVLLCKNKSKNNSHYNSYYTDIKNNHALKPIEQVQLLSTACADGQYLINDYSPQINSFCSCTSSSQQGTCSSSQLSSCTQSGTVPSYHIPKIDQAYLCAKYSDVSYFDTRIPVDNKCDAGYQICGKDTKSELCFPDTKLCPINNFVLTQENKTDLLTTGYEQQSMETHKGNLYLYTSRKQTNDIIPVEFRYGGDQMCVNRVEEQAPLDQFKFLDKSFGTACKSSLNGTTYDNRWMKMLNVNKKDLYTDNKILQEYNKVPGFDSKTLDYTTSLHKRPWIHFNKNCRDMEESYAKQNKSIFDSINSNGNYSYRGWFIALIVLACIVLALSLIFCVLKIIKIEPEMIFLILILIPILILIFMCIVFWCLYCKAKNRNHEVNKFASLNCGDEYFNALAHASAGNLSSIPNALWWGGLLTSIGLGVFAAYLISWLTGRKPTTDVQYGALHHELGGQEYYDLDDRKYDTTKRVEGTKTQQVIYEPPRQQTLIVDNRTRTDYDVFTQQQPQRVIQNQGTTLITTETRPQEVIYQTQTPQRVIQGQTLITNQYVQPNVVETRTNLVRSLEPTTRIVELQKTNVVLGNDEFFNVGTETRSNL